MQRALCLILSACIGTAAVAEDLDYEIVFYLQPDSSGQNTQNKSLELDDGELTIEESGETRNRYVERDATDDEAGAIRAFVETGLAQLSITASDDVPYPHVEMQIEVETGAMEIELSRTYPAGAVPDEVRALQARFFDSVFE